MPQIAVRIWARTGIAPSLVTPLTYNGPLHTAVLRAPSARPIPPTHSLQHPAHMLPLSLNRAGQHATPGDTYWNRCIHFEVAATMATGLLRHSVGDA